MAAAVWCVGAAVDTLLGIVSNLNCKGTEDTRTPDELLAVIEAKGKGVSEALAVLRKWRWEMGQR